MIERGKSDKIVDLGSDPWLMIQDPQSLFDQGNVFRVSPLPSRACVNACLGQIRCEECGNSFLKLVDFNCSGRHAAILGRCPKCAHELFGFFSESQPWTADIVVVKGSSRDYLDQLDDCACPDCGSGVTASFPDHTKWQQIAPGTLHCQGCPRELNLIFWERPMRYFSYVFDMAQSVQCGSPAATVLLVVAALESYLQKAFILQSEFNRALVKRRKVAFLRPQEARRIYQEAMDVDIKDTVSEETWASVCRAVYLRNCFAHNSGLSRQYARVELTSCEVRKLMQAVQDLTQAVDNCLTGNCLI